MDENHPVGRLSALTDRMLDLAERCEWSAVAALEAERGHIIARLAKQAHALENDETMRTALQTMLEANERIHTLATASRLESLVALESASTSTRLAKTYGATE